MPSTDTAVLAILPVIMWAISLFVLGSRSRVASQLRATLRAKTKKELIDASGLWAMIRVAQTALVISLLICWSWAAGFEGFGAILNPTGWGRNSLKGAAFGLALIGLLVVLKAFFPETRKFGLIIKTGFALPVVVRISSLGVVLFGEELWRAVSLKALLAGGWPGPQALIASAIAYGLTYLAWGPPLAISEAITGVVLGALFLWSGSLFVPLAAHLIICLQTLLAVSVAAPDSLLANLDKKPFATCPVCKARLAIRQVKLSPSESFFCPSCQARLTVSDWNRGFFQWVLIIVFTGCLFISWEFFPELMKAPNYWIVFATMPFLGLGVRVFLLVAFPPKLVCGDPNFVRLELPRADKTPAASTDVKKEDKANPQ